MKMNNITSITNEKIKNLKKLRLKKERDQIGQFLVENLLIIHDAVKAGFKPSALFVTQDILEKLNKEFKFILDSLDEVYVIDSKVNKSFSTLVTPSGICAVFTKQEKEIDLAKNIVYLNAVSDPGNLGTIMRTALAFGVGNIVVDEDCADIYNPKTINAARDAIFKVNVTHDSSLDIFKKIKTKMKVYATNLEKGVNIENIKINNKEAFCIVFGNEANGVSKQILNQSDEFIKIDMSKKIESLNVAISAGIIFHYLWRNK